MQIDYSKYTIDELEDALRSVDPVKYPQNKQAIEAELTVRKSSDAYRRDVEEAGRLAEERRKASIIFAQKAEIWIAWYLILTTPIMLWDQVYLAMPNIFFSPYVLIGLGTVYCSLVGVAAIALLRNKKWKIALTTAVLAFQLPHIESDALSYHVSSFFNVYVIYGEGGVIGISGVIDPGIFVALDTGASFEVGLNIVIVVIFGMLFRANEESY